MSRQDSELKAQQVQAKAVFQKLGSLLDGLDVAYKAEKITHSIVEIPSWSQFYPGHKQSVSVLKYSYDESNIENTGAVLKAIYGYWYKHLKDTCVMHLQIHDQAYRAKHMWGWKPSRSYDGFAMRGGRSNLVELYFPQIQDDPIVSEYMEDMAEEYLDDLHRLMRNLLGSAPDVAEVVGTDESTVDFNFKYDLKDRHDVVTIEDVLGSYEKSYGGGVRVQVDEVYVTESHPLQVIVSVSVKLGHGFNG